MSCPDERTLQQLVLGLLPAADAEVLARHLEQCDRCAATVHSRPVEDTLVAAARAQAPSQPHFENEAVDTLIGRLSGLWTAQERSPDGPQPPSGGAAADQAAAIAGLLTPPLAPDELGRLGHYRVLKVIGAGGMGVVFLAEDPTLNRQVALKTLQPAIATNPEARARFLREARAVAALEDERIVPIYQVGEERGIPFFAMQLLRGQTLEERLRDAELATGSRTMPLAEAVHIACETARGLATAHTRGLIHRDIKPANIFLINGGVKILDFGLARGIDDALALTQPGVVAGTPAYLAPELLAGAAPDERCDLFGLGCVLYRMMTGQAAFAAAAKRDFAEPASPRDINPEVPAELSELMVQLLARDPARRPPSAQATATRLAEIAEGLSSVTIAPPPSRRRSRWTWATGIAAAIAIAATLAGVMYFRTERGEFMVEIDDPEVAVLLAPAGGITLHDRRTDRTYVLTIGRHELPTGEYELDVREAATKLEFSTPRFTIKRGDHAKVTVSLRGQPRAWLNYVAALPAKQQLEAVAQKLRDLNPGFVGEIGPRIEDGKVVEAHIKTDHVTDISPFRALVDLEILVIHGSESAKGILEDISPVRSLKHLRYLDCSANRVRDLSPLRGMALQELGCWANPIRDLTPLRGMPLTMLHLDHTYASELWPLHNMPLQRLYVDTHYATDPTPLAGLPLNELHWRFRPERHAHVLRKFRSLVKINDRPVEEFWKELDARRAEFEPWIKRVAVLPAKQQLEEVAAKLRELNPGFQRIHNHEIENDQVARIDFNTDHVTDISPVRALTKLQRLGMPGSGLRKGQLYDLDPIRELPIAFLQFSNTVVGDLSSLAGMKVQVLLCDHTPVRDLSLVKSLPVFYLDCRSCLVEDLTPLKNSGVHRLDIRGCRIKDLSPLAAMHLVELRGDFESERDAELLRSIKPLQEINGKPAAEFWREFHPK